MAQFVSLVLADLILLIKAPIIAPDMLWVVIPLVVSIVMLTIYFGRYHEEELGWSTAMGNSIVLFFTMLDLLRSIYSYTTPPSVHNYAVHDIKTLFIVVIMLEGLYLARAAFHHAMPKHLLFFATSTLPVNVQAYIMTVFVYTRIRPDFETIVAAFVLYALLFLLMKGVTELAHVKYGVHEKAQARKYKPL